LVRTPGRPNLAAQLVDRIANFVHGQAQLRNVNQRMRSKYRAKRAWPCGGRLDDSDVQPSDCFLDTDGLDGVVRLLGFGDAIALAAEVHGSSDGAGQAVRGSGSDAPDLHSTQQVLIEL